MGLKESKIKNENKRGHDFMKKDTYKTLVGFRDICYNDFNFEVDVKNFYLGTDSYKKINDILVKHQEDDEALLTSFEEGSDIYQDYGREYLSTATKREIQHDINAAREFKDNFEGNKDDFDGSYKAFLDENSLSYAFGLKSNLDEVQADLNEIETDRAIIWQRRENEYILLPHTVKSLQRIRDRITKSRDIEDKELRHTMEKLFNNLNKFLEPFSERDLGKHEDNLTDEQKNAIMDFALDVQLDTREEGAEKVAKFALETAEKDNNE